MVRDLELKRKYNKNYYQQHKQDFRLYEQKRKKENLAKYLYDRAKTRAKKRGLEFNIEVADIVIHTYCPVLKIKLVPNVGKAKDSSPTLDRINNSKGYIKGNISVISRKANRRKSDLTLTEAKRLVKYMQKKI